MSRTVFFEEELRQSVVPISLGRGLIVGRLTGKVDQASEFLPAGNGAALFLVTRDHSIQPINPNEAQMSIECEDGEFWVQDYTPDSHVCRLNNEAFTRRKLLMNDRLSIGGGFHFRFDGDCLIRVNRNAGAEIEVHHLTKYYTRSSSRISDRIYAVNDVSMHIRPNEFVGIIGPSGCGKSTLLNLLSGALSPNHGSILIDGVDPQSNVEEARGMIGVVPQDDIVHPELTIWEAVKMSAGLRLPSAVNAKVKTSLAERVLLDLGLWQRRNNRISELSGGQRKRASIAVEMLKESSLLILDEPSSGLDPASEEKLMDQLRELSVQGRTVICTTHILDLAYLFDRILFIAHGRVIFDGSVDGALRFFRVETLRGVYSRLEDPQYITELGIGDSADGGMMGGTTVAEIHEPGENGWRSYNDGCEVDVSSLDRATCNRIKRLVGRGGRVLLDMTGENRDDKDRYPMILDLWKCAKVAGGSLAVLNYDSAFEELVQAHRCWGMIGLYTDRETALRELRFEPLPSSGQATATTHPVLLGMAAILVLSACIFVWWLLLH